MNSTTSDYHYIVKTDQPFHGNCFDLTTDHQTTYCTGELLSDLVEKYGDVFLVLDYNQYKTLYLDPYYESQQTDFFSIKADRYNDLLNVFTPARWSNNIFLVPEAIDGPLYTVMLNTKHGYYTAVKYSRFSNNEIRDQFHAWHNTSHSSSISNS